MSGYPSGTVTLLFTDIEGSTKRWEALPAAMAGALRRHDDILRRAIEQNGGVVFKTIGDAFCAAFASAPAAVGAALAAQRALAAEEWGEVGTIRARMALHTGTPEHRENDYFGPPVNRVARLLSAGYGGQVLISRATQELVHDGLPADAALRDLGEHRLKDLSRPEGIFQLVAADLQTDFPPVKTLDHRPNNLPAQLTPLVGREREVAAVADLLRQPDVRLVTLTGPGGTGKTRLGLQAAAELVDEFGDGVWFVDLVALTDGEVVPMAIAEVLGVREEPGRTLFESLVDYLHDRRLLLLLDNFEQVVAASAVVEMLLKRCPRLKVLVTSQHLLRAYGEHEYPLDPLPVPEVRGSLAVEDLTRVPAVQLFVERARAAKQGFDLTAENAGAIAEICRRLDGLPLAIELAAARIRLMPPQAMRDRLGDRLGLLAGGARTLHPRQQTLRNAIAWSFDLLDPAEQQLLARLGVFAGGADFEAIEAVARSAEFKVLSAESSPSQYSVLSTQHSVFDGLESLVQKSLVRQTEQADGTPRFVMLQTIRDFALERLAQSGEEAAVRAAHAAYYLGFAERAEPELEGMDQGAWLDRLELEHDNLRAALHLLRDAEDDVRATRMVAALWRFWSIRGYFGAGREEIEGVLMLPPSPAGDSYRVTALNGAGTLAESQGDYRRAESYHRDALALARQLDDQRGIASSLGNLGYIALAQGETELAKIQLEEALALAEAEGDQATKARILTDLHIAARYQGNFDRARLLLEESLALFRKLGNTSHVAISLGNLAAIASDEGEYRDAYDLLHESLELKRALGEKRGINFSLNSLAMVTAKLGDDVRAIELIDESLSLSRETGDKLATGMAFWLQADFVYRQGDLSGSKLLYRRALALFRMLDDGYGMAGCVSELAKLAAEDGKPDRAAHLWGAAAGLWRDGYPLGYDDSDATQEAAVSAVRLKLGNDAFEEAWAKGRQNALDQIAPELVDVDRDTPWTAAREITLAAATNRPQS